MIFATSDTHFGHKRIFEDGYCPTRRAWFDYAGGVKAHDEALIAIWNRMVSPDDTVVHCGDFCFGGAKQIRAIRERLNGRLLIVRGNHDFGDRSLSAWRNAVACRAGDCAGYGLRLTITYGSQGVRRYIIVHHMPTVSASPQFGFSPVEVAQGDELWHGHIHDRPFKAPTLKHRAFGIDTHPGLPFTPVGSGEVFVQEIMDKPTNSIGEKDEQDL